MGPRLTVTAVCIALLSACNKSTPPPKPETAAPPAGARATAPPASAQATTPPDVLPPGHPPIPMGNAGPHTAASKPAAKPIVLGADRRLPLRSLTAKLPDGWKAETPKSNMRVAQIALPLSEGDHGKAELIVYYFPGGAGGKEANLKRWAGQFAGDPDELYKKAKKEDITVGGFETTTFDLSGTIKASAMPGAPATGARADHRMFAAIVTTDDGPYYFKATGPIKTMDAQGDAFHQFLASLRKKK